MARKRTKRGRHAVVKRKPVKRKPVKQSLPPLALSVAAWCAGFGIGRTAFYKMLRRGEAPPTLLIGRRRVITIEATQQWQRTREAMTQAAA